MTLLNDIQPHKNVKIVAEISCSHCGKIDQAYELIDTAIACGASAVKIQAYTPEELTIQCDKPEFQIRAEMWKNDTLWSLYNQTYTPLEWLPDLFAYAKERKIFLFSSVFGTKSLEALEKVNCPIYKIASFEFNDTNLLREVASTGKQMVMSTGVATLKEIERAVDIIEARCDKPAILMYCVSKYPATKDTLDFSKLIDLLKFYTYAGYSDHTLPPFSAEIAVTLGACLLEKHLTIDADSKDARFALYPNEFTNYVQLIKHKLSWFGEPLNKEIDLSFKRSLYVVRDIKAGEKLTPENVRSIRPGFGLDPDLLHTYVLGKTASVDLELGTALKMEHMNV